MQQLEFLETKSSEEITTSLAACIALASSISKHWFGFSSESPEDEVYWHVRENVYEFCIHNGYSFPTVISKFMRISKYLDWSEGREDCVVQYANMSRSCWHKVCSKEINDIIGQAIILDYMMQIHYDQGSRFYDYKHEKKRQQLKTYFRNKVKDLTIQSGVFNEI